MEYVKFVVCRGMAHIPGSRLSKIDNAAREVLGNQWADRERG
jgi:hypothetical protein